MNFEQKLKEFENFEIEILINNANLQQFRCRNKNGDGNLRFEVVCTDYAIYVSGDMGELVLQQYGRGLKWMRETIKDKVYFLSKVSHCIKKTEFSEKRAIAVLKDYIETYHPHYEDIDECDADTRNTLLETLNEWSRYGIDHEYEYYDKLSNFNTFDGEYPNPRVLKNSVEWIYAGLYWFCEKLNEVLDIDGVNRKDSQKP